VEDGPRAAPCAQRQHRGAALARDAALAAPHGDLTTRADILTHLAEILVADGDVAGATKALDEGRAPRGEGKPAPGATVPRAPRAGRG
jgi:hypothetical protein